MKNNIVAFVVGFIFAIGLGISGMTNPAKVVGFLNVVKNWDPALMFVMIGAIPVNMIAYRLIKNWKKPLFDKQFHVPTSQLITKELVIGAILFGIGWGIAGYCPGPAITSLASLQSSVVVFLIAMLVGMFAYQKLNQK